MSGQASPPAGGQPKPKPNPDTNTNANANANKNATHVGQGGAEVEPLWCGANRDCTALALLAGEEIGQAEGSLLAASARFFRPTTATNAEEGQGQRQAKGPAPSTSAAKAGIKDLTGRLSELEAATRMLAGLRARMQGALDRLKSVFLAFVIARDEVSPASLERVLETGAWELYAYHLAVDMGRPPPNTPYDKYEQLLDVLHQHIQLLHLAKFLHVSKPLQLAVSLFEHTKGVPLKDISGLPNWPGIWNCFRVIDKMIARLQTASRPPCILCEEELVFYQSKLQVCKAFLFNNSEIRTSRSPKLVEKLDFDLSPYLLKPERDLLIEFLSPTDYVMDAFRSIVQTTPYRLLKVDGDGNCFFRAVTRFFYPNIPKPWEDVISLQLRKLLNQGLEKKLRDQGREAAYPYQGFVIEGINDSIAMARPGVWADHVQVQKLAMLLKRPISLITFDDVGIRMDREGRLTPGVDYVIEKQFGRDPVILFFTPSPGHYDSLQFTVGRMERSIREELAELTDLLARSQESVAPPPIPAQRLCSLFFYLEQEASLLREMASRATWSTGAVHQAISAELRERTDRLLGYLGGFQRLIDHLGEAYLSAVLRQHDAPIHLLVLRPLFRDMLRFQGQQPVSVGDGPLSRLLRSLPRLSITLPPVTPSKPRTRDEDVFPSVLDPTLVSTSAPSHATAAASNDEQVEVWKALVGGGGGNVIRLVDRHLSAESLLALGQTLCNEVSGGGRRVEYLILCGCTLAEAACHLLAEDSCWPLCLRRVELHSCTLADPAPIAAATNKRLFANDCRPTPTL